MKYIFSVEGNIGSGKSTLVRLLKEKLNDILPYYNVIFLQEPVDEWTTIKDDEGNIIEKFYADNNKWAFSFQMMAYISRISILRKVIRENNNCIIIVERSVYTDKNVFAKMLYNDKKINEINYQIYLKWFDEFTRDIDLTGIIYVKTTPEICLERILKRNRKGETIPIEYLARCHQYHDEWIMNESVENVLSLDGNKDNTSENYHEIISVIKNFINSKSVMHIPKSSINLEEHINNLIC